MLIQGFLSNDWRLLTPDNTGSYVNGRWSTIATPQQCFDTRFQATEAYQPLYFASAVLPDGRVVAIGGEYNRNLTGDTNLGEIYDPAANAWSCLSAPSGWNRVGDAMSVVQSDGTFLLGNFIGVQVAKLNASANPPVWTVITPSGKTADQNFNNEEGWTLLPDGQILTLEIWNASDSTSTPALIYSPTTQQWTSAGTAPDPLVLLTKGNTSYMEVGPAVLRPDGTVFVSGATGLNDIYNSSTNAWTSGPSFPTVQVNVSCNNVSFGTVNEQLAPADAPAALLPDGNVLIEASPVDANCSWIPPSTFFEFDGTNLTQVAATANSVGNVSFNGRLLVLPNGQILFTDTSGDVEVYSASGSPNPAWAPTITTVPSTIGAGGTSIPITGTQFNGLSGAVAYGDDYQAATNYPLVRITNTGTSHVFYAKTHGHSSMGVATGNAQVSTLFDAPAGVETGPSSLVVVTNGIASAPMPITVLTVGATALTSSVNPSASGQQTTLTARVTGASGTPSGTVTFLDGNTSTATVLGTVTLSGGVAALQVSSLAIGTHSILAEYSGDATFGATGSGVLVQVVHGLASATTLHSSLNPTTLGQSVGFTATVSGTGPTPTGTVTFLDTNQTLDGNTSLGSVTLSSGQVILPATAALLSGVHSVSAQYSGDANYSGSTSGALVQTVDYPVPVTSSLGTTSVVVGAAGFNLVVHGSNFIDGAVISFNGSARSTTLQSSSQVTAAILASDLITAGTFPVTVTNLSPGGGASNSQSFSVNNPAPVINSISPTSALAGGAAFTLTVNGTGFISTSVVNISGNARATTFASSNQLTATITAADIVSGGSFPITVFTAAPGGGTSNSSNLAVNSPGPNISSLSPSNAIAGGSAFTLVVNGTGFASGAVVNFNGSARPTTFVSSTVLNAAITANDIAAAGSFSVTVTDPAPGGTSPSSSFGVNNPVATLASVLTSGLLGHAPAGSALTLVLGGSNFVAGAVVNFNGKAETPTSVSANQITVTVPASDNATGGSIPVTVTNPGPGGGASTAVSFPIDSYTVSGPANPVSVATGQPANFQIALAPSNANGYANSVTLSASGQPAGANVTFSQNPVQVGTTGANVTMTIATVAPNNSISAAPAQYQGPFPDLAITYGGGLFLILVLGSMWLVTSPNIQSGRKVPLAVFAICAACIIGCAAPQRQTTTSSKTPQNYTITITAISGTVTQTTQVALTVN